ncbi:MAG TPA: hypothetical protein VL096_12985 [Pirellulaceae bacterium]|nr:hypothetical protein [Pirellulaceae bacterium]
MTESSEFPEWEELHAQHATAEMAAVRGLLKRCDDLAALQIVQVTFGYEGSGDEGEDACAEAFDAERQPVEMPPDMAEELCELADELIPAGYANNDGGRGEITLDVTLRQVRHEHHDYYIEVATTEQTYDLAFLDRAEQPTNRPPPSP